MNEALALSLLCVASALFYGADRPLGVARWPMLSLADCRAARVLAVALVVVAGLSWHASEPGPAAFFSVLLGLMSFGSLITLLAPAWPRLLWVLLGVAIPLGLSLAYLGRG
ncbi:MAG: hypothetical protein ABI895_07910 [Deltaproteobacteria bacterium]